MKFEPLKYLRSKTWIALSLCVLALFLHYTNLARPFENILIRMIQPVQAAVFKVSQLDTISGVSDAEYGGMTHDELVEENKQLRDQVNNLRVDNAHLRTLVDDITLLKEQVDFLEKRSFASVTAKVTSRSTETLSQTLIINRGSEDGVAVGLPVIADNGIVVGTIAVADPYSAEVLLITSSDSLISGIVQNEERSQGILKGEHNISLVMDYIPEPDSIKPSQSVVTSGADPSIPKGLVIGEIQEVIQEPGSLFQRAAILPYFDPAAMTIVSVLLP
ncbi:MAG: rod shape-determining protein MreC [Candidatus Kerfeldbacteria bacterium]